MSHREERKLARRLVGLERRADAARTKQLPFTAIELDDGTSQGITDGVSAAVDAYALAGAHDEGIGELGDIVDASAIEGTFLPERLAVSEGSADAAFELGLIASERVGEALTAANDAAAAAAGVSAIAEGAKTAADAAQAAAGAASTTAAEAKAAADQAAADAVTKAAEAEAAAKEYAAAQATAAEAAAKAAASDDAAAKADAAEAAAQLAAAADAKAKADAAQAAAEEKAAAAQSTANGAATAAADAATRANAARELALQNMRYRQVDGGAIDPPEPEGGFRINAQRVKVNASGQPYQIDRWSGTAWVRDQLLADQILVPDENGAISIGEARIVAPTVIGGEFYGNSFDGGEFRLSTVASEAVVIYDTCETVGSWTRYYGTVNPVRSSVQKKAGTYSILVGLGSANGITRPIPTTTFDRGGYYSVWVYSEAAQSVMIFTDPMAQTTVNMQIPAGVWVEVRKPLLMVHTATSITVLPSNPNARMWVDEVRIVRYATLAGSAALSRDLFGRAMVSSVAADNTTARLFDGKFEIRAGEGDYATTVVTSKNAPHGVQPVPVKMMSMRDIRDQSEVFMYQDVSYDYSQLAVRERTSSGSVRDVGSINFHRDASFYFGGAAAPGVVVGGRIALGETLFRGPVKFQGDTDWTPITPGPGWSAVGGHTPRCRVLNGVLWIEGALLRGSGGALTNLGTIPSGVPLTGGKTVFIGGHAIAKGTTYGVAEVYLSLASRILQINGYSNIDSGTGWVVPISGSMLADQT